MLNQEFRPQKRGKAFTEQEKLLLYQCMLPDLDLIDNKAMDSITVVRKSDAWRRVTHKFNSDPTVVCKRTTEQLKKCFENAKCRKQWVVDSGTGMLQPSPQTNPNSRTSKFQNKVMAIQDNAIALEDYEGVQYDVEQRLDNIKCELVDIADGSDEMLDDSSEPTTTVDAQVQPSLTEFIDGATHSDYREQNLLEKRLTSNSDGIGDDLDDVSGTVFLDQSIYRPAEVYSGQRKRLRRRTDHAEVDDERTDDHAKVAKNSQIQALQERLLRAQVREAEAAASAAETQLQLSQLALQHAQAEEARRKQLHGLRVRRLTQLVGDPLCPE